MSRNTLTPFEQALLDASLEAFSDIPESEEEINVTFSPRFEKASYRLLMKTSRRIWRYTNTAAKRVAVAAVIVAALTMTAMAIPAVREAVIAFFLGNRGTHYEVTFDPEQAANAPEQIEAVFLPTYLPEGFRQGSASIVTAGVSVIWADEAQNFIAFDQFPIPDGVTGVEDWYGINAEDVAVQTLHIGGYEVICIHDEGRTYLWTDNAYFYSLYCDSAVSDEEMQRIFCSIQVNAEAAIEGFE